MPTDLKDQKFYWMIKNSVVLPKKKVPNITAETSSLKANNDPDFQEICIEGLPWR